MEYINSFIEAGNQVLSTMAQLQCTFKQPYAPATPIHAENVVVMIGITGQLKGNAMISMNEEVAKSVASKMMMGMPVEVLDDMAKSALSELGNMIMGTGATKLEGAGIKIDITPPSLMTGNNLSISSAAMDNMCIPVDTDCGHIEITISVKK
ncbi:chemotaxis protein CheX [Peptoclostridium litorale DSM 5388]|uniref:CheC domain-containing protein n=1 Tax=Peptoclostridium litorale DSM 5388 TaxID=1121324 RepID=A0A069RJS3_PEPLI|nr:chemotaxis protein CheX [Peptoclostridium litorale]KDR94487.1 CheC domain-containing protein [Peptoclostridium litorale DSM 5388]SIO35858.1 chemotaxis protein CheX [Peptoclostridium litorale DSM 5388]